MKTLNGYEVVDAKAREDIKELQNAGHATEEYVDEAIAAIPKPDYTGLATEAYVDNAIDNIPEVDLSKHALKSELPTKVSQLQNDRKFITREEVPKTDLSEYAKKSEIPTVSDFVRNIPSEYITESELEAKGYLTKHQSLAGLATEKYVDDAIDDIPEVDLTPYAKKTDIPDTSGLAKKSDIPDTSIYAKKAELPDFTLFAKKSEVISEIPSEYVTEGELTNKGYATEYFVANKIAEAKLEGEDVDLSGYATKDDLKDFITEIPSEYVTESELNNKGYLTQHQSLSEYAKKSEIPDVSDFITGIPEEYVTETELEAKGYLTKHQSLAGLATEKYVDDKIDAIPAPDLSSKADRVHTHPEYLTQHQDLSAYAKKVDIPDVSDFISEIPDEYVTESELNAKGYLTQHQDLSAYAKKTDIPTVPTKTSQLTNDSNFITSIPSEYVTESELNAKGYLTQHQSLANYATKTYVDNAIEDIDASDKQDTLVSGVNIKTINGASILGSGNLTISGGSGTVVEGKTLILIPFSFSKNYNLYLDDTTHNLLKGVSDYIVAGNKDVFDKYAIYAYATDEPKMQAQPITCITNKDLSMMGSKYPQMQLKGIWLPSSYSSTSIDVKAFTILWQSYDDEIHVLEYDIGAGENTGGGADLSDYATITYVDNAIDGIEIPDVSNFITMSDVEAKKYLTEHQSLEGYATEKYVDDAIANIDIPEGSGGSGPEIIIFSNATKPSDAVKTTLLNLYKTYTARGNVDDIAKKYLLYFNTYSLQGMDTLLPLSHVECRDDNYVQSIKCIFCAAFNAEDYKYGFVEASFNDNPKTIEDIKSITIREYNPPEDSNTSEWDWIKTTNTSDSDLYNAREIHIRVYHPSSNNKLFSHIVFDSNTTLSNYGYEYTAFTTGDGADNQTKHWYWDGSSIVFSDDSISLDAIHYKL